MERRRRIFQRRFKARAPLELIRRAIGQVSWAVGYEDVTAFRKLAGLAPGDYRSRFAAVVAA